MQHIRLTIVLDVSHPNTRCFVHAEIREVAVLRGIFGGEESRQRHHQAWRNSTRFRFALALAFAFRFGLRRRFLRKDERGRDEEQQDREKLHAAINAGIG